MTSVGDIKISTLNISKVIEIEKSLEYALANFRDLILEIKQLNSDSSHNYKSQFLTQKEKCERKSCVGAEAMKTIVESKNNIMKIVVMVLRKFYDTKNLNILDEIFELCGENSPSKNRNNIKENENNEPKNESGLPSILSPKKEALTEENMIQDESISEIEGTPTGRTSPILQSKIFRSVTCTSSPDVRDKKKCPNTWPTPEKKAIKLLQNTPKRRETSKPGGGGGGGGGKLRQARLNLVRSKPHSVVDLTRSPEFGGGARGGGADGHIGRLKIKREPIDKDETTLPPTPNGDVTLVFKTSGSPKKAKKTSPASKEIKMEDETLLIENVETKENCPFGGGMENCTEIEDSINILRGEFKFPSDVPGQAAMRLQPKREVQDDDVTYCDIDSTSLSELMTRDGKQHSPNKSPLAENINAANGAGAGGRGPGTSASDPPKRKSPMKVEPLYKEPTVRKKAEKMALPGWSCEECEKFWGELYKDEPAMLAKKMALCSKHRGRQNPARPRTPPGFWNIRWGVPDNTEEFNRRNDAL